MHYSFRREASMDVSCNDWRASPRQAMVQLDLAWVVGTSLFGNSLEARGGWMMPIGFRRLRVKVTFDILYLIF